MAKPIVSDALWEIVEPLIPKVERRFRYPGRKRIPDRQVLAGILFVLMTGIPWEHLPQEMGCGSGMTCWRRLNEWQQQGVWARLHEVLLAKLNAADQIDWHWAAIDSSHVCAVGGREDGPEPGRPRTARLQASPDHLRARQPARRQPDRRQPQRHLGVRSARRCDPAGAGQARPARPKRIYGDRAYHSNKSRRELRARGIQAKVAKPDAPHGSGLGRYRWVVERTIAWLHQYRRLRIRYERRDDIHEAFLKLGCCLICFKQLSVAGAT